MKKLFTFIFSLIICFSMAACSCNKEDNITPITLIDDQYTELDGYIEFLNSYKILQTRFDNKSNFAFFMYGATCSGCHKFTPILQEYLKETHIKLYAIEVNVISNANRDLVDTLGATPAVAIVKDGELYEFIEGYGKDDASYFQSKEGFKSWFEKYVVVAK